MSSALHAASEQAPPSAAAPATGRSYPLWLRRMWIVLFVVLCIEMGLILVVVPWNDAWAHNSLMLAHPTLRYYLHHGFVRGAISGVGLLDIWIGVSEAISYREK